MAEAHDPGGVDTALGLPAARGILDGVLGALPGVVYRCRNDADWTMLGITDSVEELTGYAPVELIDNVACSYGDLIHPEDREKVWATVQSGVADGRSFRVVYRLVDRAGRERWVLEQGRALGDGELAGYIQDVTGPLGDRLVWQQNELDRALRQTRHLELLQEVTAIVNEASALEEALRASLPVICRGLGFVLAHAFLPTAEGGGLEPADLWWTRDGVAGGRGLDAVRARHGDPERGIPGRVQRRGRAEWVVDVHADPDLDDPDPCDGCGVESGVGVPIRSGERRLAVLEF
ncbi:MAG: PAS domain-containing protein, partial [Longimicrobiales bacterium]